MKMKPYEWQIRFLKKYKNTGVIKAFAGTGKTYATILLLKKRNYKKTIIAVPTRKLKSQWMKELNNHNVKNAFVETFHILSKEKSKGLKCEILVVDECHRSTSPVFKTLYENIKYDNILGLTATPNKACIEYCGDIILEIPLEAAKVSDFTVFFHPIALTYDERALYDEYSQAIRKYLGRMKRSDDSEKWHFREKLDYMIFRRRGVVYNAEKRIPKTIELLKKYKNKPTLVICKRIEQANTLSKITNIPVYHSEKTDEKALDDFQNDRISTLLSVGMLAEGYDKRNIQCLIIVSTAITEAYHIQSIGRAVRLPDDADIHILLCKNTTDEKLLQFRYMYKHKIVGDFSPRALKPKNPWRERFYLGDEFSIDEEGKIYIKNSNGKQYFKDNPITSALQRVLNYRKGKFRITKDKQVLIKVGGRIISVGLLMEPLEKIELKPIKKTNN